MSCPSQSAVPLGPRAGTSLRVDNWVRMIGVSLFHSECGSFVMRPSLPPSRRLPSGAPLPFVLLLLVGCSDRILPTEQPTQAQSSPLVALSERPASPIADRYIVVFDDEVPSVSAAANAAISRFGGEVHHTYHHALKGFAATLPSAALEAIARNPHVRYIEPDYPVRLDWEVSGDSVGEQIDPISWGLDRIDQRELPRDSIFGYTETGAGVEVYVVDTGIRTTHSDFGGRASAGYDVWLDPQDPDFAQDCDSDPRGHGTQVAGIIGGSEFGVAKEVDLISVRSFVCTPEEAETQDPDMAGALIEGVDWVMAQKLSNPSQPMVLNFSGSSVLPSVSLDESAENAVAEGIVMITSAGNDDGDACDRSPGRVPEVITVGSIDATDARASSSNHGSCVDIWAPGVQVYAPSKASNTAYDAVGSGTSFAAPHVAGAAARYLELNPAATPAQVVQYLTDVATSGVLSDLGSGSPNLLLFAPGPLSAEIIGPDTIVTGVPETWVTNPRGGFGDHTYQWHKRYLFLLGPGSWEPLGTDAEQENTEQFDWADFELRVTVASAGDTVQAIQFVHGNCGNGGDPCPHSGGPGPIAQGGVRP